MRIKDLPDLVEEHLTTPDIIWNHSLSIYAQHFDVNSSTTGFRMNTSVTATSTRGHVRNYVDGIVT